VTGKILRIHISESDRWQGEPLHEAIVAKCREMKIAGATVLAGLEGYGTTAEMHKAHLIHSNRPILIVIVDTAENIERLIPVVEAMMDTGLLAVSDVETIRVETGT
jgi:PII-like signaling protein